MINKKAVSISYDSSAEIYDKRYDDIQEKKYNEIFSKISLNNDSYILDLGCGTGNFLGKIKSFKDINLKKIIGIDLSFEMIKHAHKKFPDIDFIVSDSDELPLLDNLFTHVFSITHLQNLLDPKTTLEEINRTTRIRALVVISILSKTWSIDKLSEMISQFSFHILNQWIAEVEDIGLICVKTKRKYIY